MIIAEGDIMQDYDEEFGPNRIERNFCGDCGKQLDRDEICWCSEVASDE